MPIQQRRGGRGVTGPGLTVRHENTTDDCRPLSDFADWGLHLVVPDSPDEGFEYWETLSWENAGKYQADLLISPECSGTAT